MKKETLIITRTFKAPKNVVFNAFSSADALNNWWGPVQMKNSVLDFEFKVDGIFFYKMEGHGMINYGKIVFTSISPYNKLSFKLSFADESQNIIPAPFDITFPKEIHYEFNFEEIDGATKMTMTGTPINATSEELKGYANLNESMNEGFGSSFDKLAAYLTQ